MTIREVKSGFDGLKLCYIGDGNNMANSLIVGALKVGMEVSIATPATDKPQPRRHGLCAGARHLPLDRQRRRSGSGR